MTIEKEEPGMWVAYCDSCGERIVLDTSADEPKPDAVEELEEIFEWRIEQPQTVKYDSDHGVRKTKVEYEQHFCPDC